jgi:hypothetical protein
MAQGGANTQEIDENLKNLDTRVTFQPSERVTHNDVEVNFDLKKVYTQ